MTDTHMQHEWDGLHLYWCGSEVPSSCDTSSQVGGEIVVLVELFE